jgi:short-subunit dehydrogenase
MALNTKKYSKIKHNSNNILKNKNCLVTGATAGIGKAIALELASNGCNLFLTGRNSKRLENLKKKIEKEDTDLKVRICIADLSKRSEIKKVIKKVRSSFSNIDILVNSAGIFPVKLLKETEMEDFDMCFNVNIITPFLLTQEFSKEMKNNRWGRIINIGSSGAYSGRARGSIYRSTKHALLGLSKAITKELRDYHVRVFCISPGPTKTKMGKSILKKDSPNENFNTFIEPDDIAKFTVHLISFDTELFIQEIRLGRIIGEK